MVLLVSATLWAFELSNVDCRPNCRSRTSLFQAGRNASFTLHPRPSDEVAVSYEFRAQLNETRFAVVNRAIFPYRIIIVQDISYMAGPSSRYSLLFG